MRLALLIFAPVLGLLASARLDVAQSNTISESRRREFLQHPIAAAIERTHHVVRYDPAYVRISYPGGDVPADTGVCTDEII